MDLEEVVGLPSESGQDPTITEDQESLSDSQNQLPPSATRIGTAKADAAGETVLEQEY